MKTKYKKQYRAMDFGEHLRKELKDPVFRKHYNEYGKQLEIAYQISQLRKKEGISQKELAKKVPTQSYQEMIFEPSGTLSDVAPTILDLMKIDKPEEMTGISLLDTMR